MNIIKIIVKILIRRPGPPLATVPPLVAVAASPARGPGEGGWERGPQRWEVVVLSGGECAGLLSVFVSIGWGLG